MHFCRRCGKQLEPSKGHIYHCPNGHTLYANHSPAVGIFFISPDNKEVLLTRRGIEPGKDMLGTLGGFLDAGENLEDAATRELHEEGGLISEDYGPFTYVTSASDTYEYQGEAVPVITTFFWARLTNIKNLQAADEVASLAWHTIATINLEQVAAHDVRMGIRKLREIFQEKDND